MYFIKSFKTENKCAITNEQLIKFHKESIMYSASSSNKETSFSKHKTEKRQHGLKYLVSKRSAISKYNFLLCENFKTNER